MVQVTDTPVAQPSGVPAGNGSSPAQQPSSLGFTEEMKGYVTLGETDYDRGFRQGKQANTPCMFHLDITAEDVDHFVQDPNQTAVAVGYVRCPAISPGDMKVEKGVFNLLVDVAGPLFKNMKYRLFIRDAEGNPLTLAGHKNVQDERGEIDVWSDTTTLFTHIFRGHVEESGDATAEIVASGILHIGFADFMKLLTTIRTTGPTAKARNEARAKFGELFMGSLWEVYGSRVARQKPAIFKKQYEGGDYKGERTIPLYTLEGVKDAAHETISFCTEDRLGLSFERFTRDECDDVVIIAHGLTTSTDMFIMPEHYNLVSYLLDHGFTDVWSLDFRMSNRHSYNLTPHRMNMDDIALFDFPAAIQTVRDRVGPDKRIHVIAHCLGAVSFAMSLFGKAVEGVTSAIVNSAALTPRVPRWSQLKIAVAPTLVEYVLGYPYLNPRWSYDPGLSSGKVFSKVVGLFHRECNVPACHMLSMMWGTGWPALYEHENLDDVTHKRGGDLYGGTSMHYYRHVRKMVKAKRAVKFDPSNPKYDRLPNDYFERVAEVETPVLFMTGEKNRVFTDSNVYCYQQVEKLAPGRHELHVFPGYGHQDPFMGKNNHRDIFPRLVQFLEKHSGPRPVSA